MPTYYVEDYEAVTGRKIPQDEVEAKVITAPPAPKKSTKTQAETK
jgi:hypothetical protein